MTTLVVLFVLVLIVSGLIAMMMARKKGYDGELFFIGGMLSGPLAIWAARSAHKYDIEDEPEHQPDPTATSVTPQQPWQATPQAVPQQTPPARAPQPAPQAAPQPAPQAAPRPAPQAAPQPAPQAAPQPAPQAAPQPAPQAAPQPAPQPQPVTPEPVAPSPASGPQTTPEASAPPQPLAQTTPSMQEALQSAPPPIVATETATLVLEQDQAVDKPQEVQSLVALITSEPPQTTRYTMPPEPAVQDSGKKGLFRRKSSQPAELEQAEIGFGVLTVPVPPGQATLGECPHCKQQSCADWYGLCVHCLEPFPVSVAYIDPDAQVEEAEVTEEERPDVKPPKKSLVEKLRQPIKIGR